MVKISKRIENLSGYAFAEIEQKVSELKNFGISPIDFGVGDPIDPTPEIIRQELKIAVDRHQSSGYPSYIGNQNFRQEIARFSKNRFGIELDPEKEICSTIGSKEAVFHFPLAFVDTGDVVISVTPGYPPYIRGTSFAGGENFLLSLKKENNFLPDLSEIPEEIAERAKIFWINFPGNPTGAVAPDVFFRDIIDFCHKWDIILASDECYTEIFFDSSNRPRSVLEFSKENIITFHSLSKRSNMTGYRIGWVAGDDKIVSSFKKIKTNIDSGTPDFIQDAASAALRDEIHVEKMRQKYAERKNILLETFRNLNFPIFDPPATFYIWQQAPVNMTGIEFAKKLLDPKIGIVVTPGEFISENINGENPGKNFVRFALVPDEKTTKIAAEKISQNFNG